MIKLYKKTESKILYWEYWDDDDGTNTIHWGIIGKKGDSDEIKGSLFGYYSY